MNKDTITGLVAIAGIALAIGVLVFGDRSEPVAKSESAPQQTPETPKVVYKTVERTVIVEQEVAAPAAPQSAPYAVRRAAAEMRAHQAQQISDVEPSDEEAMRAALQAEAAGYRRGI